MIKKPKNSIVVLLMGLALLTTIIVVRLNQPPEIIEATPSINSTEVLPELPLVVTVSKPLQNPSIVTSPNVATKISWNSETKTLIVTPLQGWSRGALQSVTIVSGKKEIGTVTFTTRNFTQSELTEQLKQQAVDDALSAQDTISYLKEKPWINKLPIETDTYRIVYDYTLGKLRIRLKTEANVIKDALAKLTELAIPYQQIGYVVLKSNQ